MYLLLKRKKSFRRYLILYVFPFFVPLHFFGAFMFCFEGLCLCSFICDSFTRDFSQIVFSIFDIGFRQYPCGVTDALKLLKMVQRATNSFSCERGKGQDKKNVVISALIFYFSLYPIMPSFFFFSLFWFFFLHKQFHCLYVSLKMQVC